MGRTCGMAGKLARNWWGVDELQNREPGSFVSRLPDKGMLWFLPHHSLC